MFSGWAPNINTPRIDENAPRVDENAVFEFPAVPVDGFSASHKRKRAESWIGDSRILDWGLSNPGLGTLESWKMRRA